MPTLYEDLDLPPSATEAQIKSAYRKKAKSSHPDAGGDPETFTRIGRAYLILRDPDRRAKYDRDGDESAEADNTFAKLAQFINQVFISIFENVDIESIDLVATANQQIDQAINQARQALLSTEAKITKWSKFKKRIKYKGDRVDVLTQMAETQSADLLRTNEKTKEDIKFLEDAKEYIKFYKYSFRKKEENPYRTVPL